MSRQSPAIGSTLAKRVVRGPLHQIRASAAVRASAAGPLPATNN